MNRYHRPVLSVGGSDKKIFLKSASKKRKVFVFFAIVMCIGAFGVYNVQKNKQANVQGLEAKHNLWDSLQENASLLAQQVQDFAQDCIQSVRQRYEQRQKLRKQELDFIVQEYSENENLSRVVFGQSWLGQKLFEKHQLNDFATLKLNRFYQVNRNAYILSETEKNKLGEYPVLSGPWSQKESHSLNDGDREVLAQGIELLALFNQYPQISEVMSELNYNKDYGWVMFSTSPGMTVTFGRKGFKEKTQRLLRVMKQYRGNVSNVKSIDLDYGDLAIVKLRKKGEQHGQS